MPSQGPSNSRGMNNVHRDLIAVEREVKHLEEMLSRTADAQAETRRLQQRLQTMRRASAERERALAAEVEQRQEELARVNAELAQAEQPERVSEQFIQTLHPLVQNGEPLGESLSDALKPRQKSKPSGAPPPARRSTEVDESQPVGWPPLDDMSHLWLASCEVDAAFAWTDSSRTGRSGSLAALSCIKHSPGLPPASAATEMVQEIVQHCDGEVIGGVIVNATREQAALANELRRLRERLLIVHSNFSPMMNALAVEELQRVEHLERQGRLLDEIAVFCPGDRQQREATRQRRQPRQSRVFSEDQNFAEPTTMQPRMRTVENEDDVGDHSLPTFPPGHGPAIQKPQAPQKHKPINTYEELEQWLSDLRVLKHQVEGDFVDPWGGIVRHWESSLHAQRSTAESLRTSVAAAQVEADRTVPGHRITRLEQRSRALLELAAHWSGEALKALEPLAIWCSGVESALILAGLEKDENRWAPVAASAPRPADYDHTKFRNSLAAILKDCGIAHSVSVKTDHLQSAQSAAQESSNDDFPE